MQSEDQCSQGKSTCAFAFEGAYFVGLNSLNVAFIVQVLAHLLDMVFYSDEKERVIPLLVNIMHYVVPYLRNHRWICFFLIIIYYAILSFATSNANKQKNKQTGAHCFHTVSLPC